MRDRVPDEQEDQRLAQAGIGANAAGIPDYCAGRGWFPESSSVRADAYPRRLRCVTIFPVRADDPTQPDRTAEEISRVCLLPDDDTGAAAEHALIRAARSALALALAEQGV
jgi:hypothetical protein